LKGLAQASPLRLGEGSKRASGSNAVTNPRTSQNNTKNWNPNFPYLEKG